MNISNNKWLEAAQGLLFPWRRCLICGATSMEVVCPQCATKLQNGPWRPCRHCATFVQRPVVVCGHCVNERLPAIDKAVAVAPYEGTLRQYILKLKYQGRRRLALPLGYAMACSARQKLPVDKLDFVTAVPTSPQRLAERGYNQAALLAQAVSQELRLPYQEETLKKIKEVKSQTQLGRLERFANLKDAFSLGSTGHALPGKRVLLVDDVFTTGATACRCAEVLKEAGAAKVYILTIAAGKSKI